MSNPYVRHLGHVEDIDRLTVDVGVDYDAVTIGNCRLNRDQCEEFGRLFVAACWEAADNARLMAEEGSQ